MPRSSEEAKEAGRWGQLEDKAQTRSEHFPMDAAAGGENKPPGGTTGKMSDSRVKNACRALQPVHGPTHVRTLTPEEDARYSVYCLTGLQTDFKDINPGSVST